MNIKHLQTCIDDYEETLMTLANRNLDKKYEIKRSFIEIRKLVNLQIAKKPIDISDDGMTFKCPNCKTILESKEGRWDEYDVCYICGQKFKDEDTLKEKITFLNKKLNIKED